jgi:Lipocalin-like domain
MNRRSILSISAATALGLAVLPSSAVAQQKSLKEQLVGTWNLISTQTADPNGNKRFPYGTSPRGILILDANGRYAAVQGRSDRPRLKSALRLQVTKEELGAAALDFAAQFGTWSVSEADKALFRRTEVALIPNFEGTEAKANITLAGDDLRLTLEVSSVTGDSIDAVYRRIK